MGPITRAIFTPGHTWGEPVPTSEKSSRSVCKYCQGIVDVTWGAETVHLAFTTADGIALNVAPGCDGKPESPVEEPLAVQDATA